MSVRIRFSRVGRPHDPFYRLVATNRTYARDAKPIEVLGAFNPRNMKKPDAFNVERVKYWFSVGALPTESVVHGLKVAGLWDSVKPSKATAKA